VNLRNCESLKSRKELESARFWTKSRHWGWGEMAWVAFLPPPPPPTAGTFFVSFFLLDIWVVFLMQNIPLDAAYLFDLNAAILGKLLAAVQPEKSASAAQTDYHYLAPWLYQLTSWMG
jgi:hypothetical protein